MELPANRIRESREAVGLRLSEVATACEVTENTVRRWESGDVLVPTKYLPTLAELFSVTVDHLMRWDKTEVAA